MTLLRTCIVKRSPNTQRKSSDSARIIIGKYPPPPDSAPPPNKYNRKEDNVYLRDNYILIYTYGESTDMWLQMLTSFLFVPTIIIIYYQLVNILIMSLELYLTYIC